MLLQKTYFGSVMFCKNLNSARAGLARVSVRLGLVFSENESRLSINNQKSRLVIKKLGIIYITNIKID